MSCCEWQVPWSQEDSLWVCLFFFFFFLFYWEMPSYFFSKVFSRIKWLVIFSDVGWIVILTPSKKEGWSPNPSKSERDLTWKPLYRGNWVKMRSLKWALIQYDWWPYKEGNSETDTHRGKWVWRDIGRRWPLKSRVEAWMRFLPQKEPPCQHLAFKLLASRSGRQ